MPASMSYWKFTNSDDQRPLGYPGFESTLRERGVEAESGLPHGRKELEHQRQVLLDRAHARAARGTHDNGRQEGEE